VLALANRPAADPNRYGDGPGESRVNRAVVHFYEPGSTFKIVPMAAALDHGKLDRREPLFCEMGSYSLGSRVIHDVSPHAMLTPGEILQKSSNIGIVKVGRTMTREELHESIVRFGFGSRTGIELPGESPGRVPAVASWSSYTRDSLVFGQEIGVTAIQAAAALAAIANDGRLVAPRVVLATRDVDGRTRYRPAPAAQTVIGPETARALREMMHAVVTDGTGSRARVEGYRVAGKSGTAQKAVPEGGYSETDFVASFGGFAPADDPRVVCLVVIDSPEGEQHQGGQVAAPVFARIMAHALPHLRVAQDDPAVPGPLVLQVARRASS
jgi:cell division protein FtsI/penicillin-binding protein 2